MGFDESKIGRLEFASIRDLFPKESSHFTKWLETHIDVLSDRLGIKLTVEKREKEVGEFSVDLLCEDENGHPVIIENQLERTDHDHLGKLLTYMVNLDAVAAIWITPTIRPEHERVVDWLNESTPDGIAFYLVKVEGLRIGESQIAPLFTVQAGPDRQAKLAGEEKKEWAERHRLRSQFWTDLLAKSRGKTTLFQNITPGRESWLTTGAGKAGLGYQYIIRRNSAIIQLDIDTGDFQKNRRWFDVFYKEKAAIEKEFGEVLEWDNTEDKRACFIYSHIPGKGLVTLEHWQSLQDQMIDCMIRFENAFRSRISKLHD